MAQSAPADRLIALFEREGYGRVEPPVLQPADIFIDLSGEDLRRRIFLTADAEGRELCLRPEYTIPVARLHLAGGQARPAQYSYGGPVFRMRPGEAGEFLQAGVESIGRADRTAADAEILGLALEALAEAGAPGKVRLGDMGLLEAVVSALKLDPAAKRRLLRAVIAGRGVGGLASGGTSAPAGLLAAIEGHEPEAVRALVEDVLAIAGLASVGGRSAAEIAERFTARSAQPRGFIADEPRGVLERYLAIAGDPDASAAAVRALAREAGLDLDRTLDGFEERTGFMAARGLDLEAIRFAADFARNLDYYTGFIFEVSDAARDDGRPLAGGGRYDGLLGHLGSPEPVPAVGFSIWLDRLPAAPSQEGGA